MASFSTAFVAPDGTTLPDFNPLFYSIQDDMEIFSDGACGSGDTPGILEMVGVDLAFSPDQFCEFVIYVEPGDFTGGIGICLRGQDPGSASGYYWHLRPSGDTASFGYMEGGAFHGIYLAPCPPLVTGDRLRAEVAGEIFSLYVNGILFATVDDAHFTDGKPGLVAYLNEHAYRATSMRAGDFQVSPPGILNFITGL
jgi:hypothetical protein